VDNASAHDNYPVHIFGRMVPKRFPPLTEEFIPYLGRSLNEAINESDSRRIQVFIRALGNVGHPSILPLFEPFLEGKKNASKFQRQLMVSALDKLANLFPKEAAAVLFKLYENTAENHEIRCAAVRLLMRTNPPANVLQRMAEFTNNDPDPQVSSMVQSAILSAANLQEPSNWQL
jgi:HEAT repeat protein